MRTTLPFVVAAAAALAACRPPAAGTVTAALGGNQVGVTNAIDKVRPGSPVPAATSASIDAARNEFEPFQIVIGGGAGGVAGVRATASALLGPGGATIPVADVRLYQVGLYNVVYASNTDGAAGEWPDPLIPDVDAYVGEKRNAFPFDVKPGVSRAIWVDVYVPTGIPAGMYAGSVTVSAASGLAPTTVPVALRVRNFDLPSTPSLKSAFGFSVDMACRAHLGQTYCNSDADAAPFIARYGQAALEHRISLWNPYYTYPKSGDFTTFDADTGPLLDGKTAARLAGAHMTTSAIGGAMWSNVAGMTAARMHFDAKGWKGLFDYTCDEPPMTCAFTDIPVRASASHAAGVRTLVTTNIDAMTQHGLLDAIDIAVPIVNDMQTPGNDAADRRGDYDAFLARSPDKEVWMYQSCESQGCGGCDASNATKSTPAWPSVQIDHPGIRNRAMEWLSYRFRMSGELYWETLFHLDDAWSSYEPGHNALCDFGGNGDGALFYPGTPARIGGKTDIPVESQRLELIREGMEDYEYLHLLDTLGGGDVARAEDVALFPAAYKVTATPAELYAARARLADAIEARLGGGGGAAYTVPRAAAPVDVHGDGSAFAAAPAITVGAGDAQATFRLLWDDAALYVAAEVADPLLLANGTGRDGELWNADGIELMFDARADHSAAPDDDDRHVIVTAAGDLLDARGAGAGEDRSLTMNVDYAVATNGSVGDGAADQGYRLIAAIPWAALGVTPAAGTVLDADVALNDVAATGLSSADWAGVKPFAQPALWKSLALGAAADGGGGGTGGNGVTDGPGGTVAPDGMPTATAAASVGCGVGGHGGTGSDGGFALVLAALALGWSRRRAGRASAGR